MSALSLAGCNENGSTPEPEPEPVPVTYSATYTVEAISDDFFTLGQFIVAYADENGKEQIVNLDKAQIPFSITVKGLKKDSRLSFDLIYGYFTDFALTKETYTFNREVLLKVVGSNGSGYTTTIKSASAILGKNKVKLYLDGVIKEEAFESTVR